jgi:hypothetical protein
VYTWTEQNCYLKLHIVLKHLCEKLAQMCPIPWQNLRVTTRVFKVLCLQKKLFKFKIKSRFYCICLTNITVLPHNKNSVYPWLHLKWYYVTQYYSHRVRNYHYSLRNNPEERSFHYVVSLYYFSNAENQHFKNLPLQSVSH